MKKYTWSWILILQLIATSLLGQTAFTKNDTISIKKDSLILRVPTHIGNVFWQFSKTAKSWDNIKNATGDSLLISKVDSSGFYRAKIINNSCYPIYSDSTYLLRALPPDEELQMKKDAGEINRNVAYFSSLNTNTTIKKIDSTKVTPIYEIVTKDITSNLNPGSLLIDTTGIGKIILIENVIEKKSTSSSLEKVISGIQVGIDYLITDKELNYSSPANRTKSEWNSPLKTPSNSVGFNKFTYNYENGSTSVTASTAAEVLKLSFASKKLWEISSGKSSLSVSLEEGTISIKPAIDFHAKYNPTAVATKFLASADPLFGIASDYLVKGGLDNLKLITYNDLDFNFKYKISASLGDNLNDLLKPVKIAEYWYGIPAGPVMLSVKTELIAKLTFEGVGELNVTPQIEWNNNIVLGALAQKTGNTFSKDFIWNYNNKKSISSAMEGKVSLKERLEIIPKMEVYISGLIGISGEIIPFQEFAANASIGDNSPLLYDCSLNIGVDANASFDISAFHTDYLTASLYTRNFNLLLNKNIYSLPYTLEYISGNNQIGKSGEYLQNSLVVKVLDSNYNTIPNYPVFYDVVSGGGSMQSDFALSNSSGVAQNQWKIGNIGSQTAKAYLLNANRTIIDRSNIDFQATVGAAVTLPTIKNSAISGITQTTATSGGNVTSDGGAPISARGVCWSTSQNPTIANSKTNDGTGTGSFTSNLTGLTANTTYYIRAYATNSIGTAYDNQQSFTTASPVITQPELTTNSISEIAQTSAISGGNIASDGGAAITARGVCWSISQNPTTANGKTNDGTGTGSFTSSLTGLLANTTYYIRAYATNSVGTAYGNELSFKTSSDVSETVTDIDGNIYHTVKIGTQVWMVENLKTTRLNDGSDIPNITDSQTWTNLNTLGFCWYNNNISNKDTYGALYNWYSVKTGKLAPIGWHIPSDAEWTTLTTYLGGESVAGLKLKETGTSHWKSPNNATNETGFSAIPAGWRTYFGEFASAGSCATWWTSTQSQSFPTTAWFMSICYNNDNMVLSRNSNQIGTSIRCLKD